MDRAQHPTAALPSTTGRAWSARQGRVGQGRRAPPTPACAWPRRTKQKAASRRRACAVAGEELQDQQQLIKFEVFGALAALAVGWCVTRKALYYCVMLLLTYASLLM